MKALRLLATTAIVCSLIGGCSAEVSLTVTPEQVEEAAEGALEQEVGIRPEISCGEEKIKLHDGHTVTCRLRDPTSGQEYDTEITLVHDSGTSFGVNVQVADQPNP